MSKVYQPLLILILFIPMCLFALLGLMPQIAANSNSPDSLVPTPESAPTQQVIYNFESFEAFMRDNPKCPLPCWWGFYPGEASADDWLDFLHTYGFDLALETNPGVTNISEGGEADFYLGFGASNVIVYFVIEQSVLTKLRIEFYAPNHWLSSENDTITLQSIISQRDSVPDVYVLDNGYGAVLPYNLNLLLVYPDVMVEYIFDLSWDNPQPKHWELCLTDAYTTRIVISLQNPADTNAISSNLPGFSEQRRGYSKFVPIDHFFSVDSEEFTQFFKENPGSCLSVTYSPQY